MKYNPNDPDRGFTILELSLVLAIVGLVVGGVLVGRALIAAGRLGQQASDLDRYTAAVNTFLNKYNYLPGDIPPAATLEFGLTPTGPNPGIGDGIINDDGGNAPIVDAWLEPYFFFVHLTDAKLIKGFNAQVDNAYTIGAGGQFPALATDPAYGLTVTGYRGANWYYLGITDSNTIPDSHLTVLSRHGVLTPAEAEGLDRKTDDGVPSTGNVLAITLPHDLPATDTTPGRCVADAAALAYDLEVDTEQCRLLIRMQ